MTKKRFAPGLRVAALSCAAALGLAACVPVQQEVYQAAQGGDFNLLGCPQLAIAEGSVRQRISALGSGGFGSSGVFTPGGGQAEDRRPLLSQHANELNGIRVGRGCEESAPIVTAAEVLRAPEPAPAAAPAPASSATVAPGRYLQVATFEIAQNRDTAVRHLRAAGLNVMSSPVTLAGRTHYRVVVGPLAGREDIRRADNAARQLGLNDAFFVAR